MAPHAAGVVREQVDRHRRLVRRRPDPVDVVLRRNERVEIAGDERPPGDELEAAVDELACKIAPAPLPVLRLTKLALVRAFEAMGLRNAVAANLDLSAILNAADTPEQREFDRIVSEQGLKAALAWRDSRYGGEL